MGDELDGLGEGALGRILLCIFGLCGLMLVLGMAAAR